jgi:hypothetical protein
MIDSAIKAPAVALLKSGEMRVAEVADLTGQSQLVAMVPWRAGGPARVVPPALEGCSQGRRQRCGAPSRCEWISIGPCRDDKSKIDVTERHQKAC